MINQQKTQSNGSGRVNAYVFRPMIDIMTYIVPLWRSTVTGGSDDETVALHNYLRSDLRFCYKYNPLTDCGSYIGDPTVLFRAWLAQQIQSNVMTECFRIWETNVNCCAQHISRSIDACPFQFNIAITMLHLIKYRSGITTDLEWMVCERAENLRSEAVLAQFAIKRFGHVLHHSFSA